MKWGGESFGCKVNLGFRIHGTTLYYHLSVLYLFFITKTSMIGDCLLRHLFSHLIHPSVSFISFHQIIMHFFVLFSKHLA